METNAAMPNSDQKPENEQQLERSYRIRQVTHYQTSWTEKGPQQPGGFTIQLILDHGVDEYILQTEAQDTEVLTRLLAQGGYIGFDLQRKVLMFPNNSAK